MRSFLALITASFLLFSWQSDELLFDSLRRLQLMSFSVEILKVRLRFVLFVDRFCWLFKKLFNFFNLVPHFAITVS